MWGLRPKETLVSAASFKFEPDWTESKTLSCSHYRLWPPLDIPQEWQEGSTVWGTNRKCQYVHSPSLVKPWRMEIGRANQWDSSVAGIYQPSEMNGSVSQARYYSTFLFMHTEQEAPRGSQSHTVWDRQPSCSANPTSAIWHITKRIFHHIPHTQLPSTIYNSPQLRWCLPAFCYVLWLQLHARWRMLNRLTCRGQHKAKPQEEITASKVQLIG